MSARRETVVFRARGDGSGEVVGEIVYVPPLPRRPSSGGWWLELGPLGSTRWPSRWEAVAEARRRGYTVTDRPAADVERRERPKLTPTGRRRRARPASRSKAPMARTPRRKSNGQFTKGNGAAAPKRRRRARGVGPARKCLGRDARGRLLPGFVLGKGGVRRKRASKPRVRVTTTGRTRDAAGQLNLFNGL